MQAMESRASRRRAGREPVRAGRPPWLPVALAVVLICVLVLVWFVRRTPSGAIEPDATVSAPADSPVSTPDLAAPAERRYSADDVAPGFEEYVPDPAPVQPRVVPPRDGAPGFTYRVPVPGDPDYADYLKMVRHPLFARFNRPGMPQWYDPEWRSAVTGRREVPVNDLRLLNAYPTVEELLETLLRALADEDRDALNFLRVNRDEFELICWPEFHHSRPINRIPPGEAWSFQFTKMNKGTTRAFNDYAGRNFSLVGYRSGEAEEFTNFRLIHGVTFTVEDNDSGERLDLDVIETLVECKGAFKIYYYAGD